MAVKAIFPGLWILSLNSFSKKFSDTWSFSMAASPVKDSSVMMRNQLSFLRYG